MYIYKAYSFQTIGLNMLMALKNWWSGLSIHVCLFIDDVAVDKLFTAQSEETSAFECFIDPSTTAP